MPAVPGVSQSEVVSKVVVQDQHEPQDLRDQTEPTGTTVQRYNFGEAATVLRLKDTASGKDFFVAEDSNGALSVFAASYFDKISARPLANGCSIELIDDNPVLKDSGGEVIPVIETEGGVAELTLGESVESNGIALLDISTIHEGDLRLVIGEDDDVQFEISDEVIDTQWVDGQTIDVIGKVLSVVAEPPIGERSDVRLSPSRPIGAAGVYSTPPHGFLRVNQIEYESDKPLFSIVRFNDTLVLFNRSGLPLRCMKRLEGVYETESVAGKCYGVSITGANRRECQDAFRVSPSTVIGIDGVGGNHQISGISELVAEVVKHALEGDENSPDSISGAVSAGYNALRDRASKENPKEALTLNIVVREANELHWQGVGDDRQVILKRDGTLIDIKPIDNQLKYFAASYPKDYGSGGKFGSYVEGSRDFERVMKLSRSYRSIGDLEFHLVNREGISDDLRTQIRLRIGEAFRNTFGVTPIKEAISELRDEFARIERELLRTSDLFMLNNSNRLASAISAGKSLPAMHSGTYQIADNDYAVLYMSDGLFVNLTEEQIQSVLIKVIEGRLSFQRGLDILAEMAVDISINLVDPKLGSSDLSRFRIRAHPDDTTIAGFTL